MIGYFGRRKSDKDKGDKRKVEQRRILSNDDSLLSPVNVLYEMISSSSSCDSSSSSSDFGGCGCD